MILVILHIPDRFQAPLLGVLHQCQILEPVFRHGQYIRVTLFTSLEMRKVQEYTEPVQSSWSFNQSASPKVQDSQDRKTQTLYVQLLP
jgi:hypothetical protein